MKILPVSDPSFQNYGQVMTGYDLKELLETLDKVTPCPDGVDYVPEQAELMALPIEKDLRNNAYGGMPIQIGWCNILDTDKVVAYLCPAGTMVEVYATTLHYAPCSAKKGQGFKVIVVLPKGTNLAKPEFTVKNAEDELMTAANKWLLAHADSAEAASGAKVCIKGVNPDIADLI